MLIYISKISFLSMVKYVWTDWNYIECDQKLAESNVQIGASWHVSHPCEHEKGFGLTPLFRERHGFMPPQLKTKQFIIGYITVQIDLPWTNKQTISSSFQEKQLYSWFWQPVTAQY